MRVFPTFCVLSFCTINLCIVVKTCFKHKVMPRQETFLSYKLSFNYINTGFDYVLMV